MMLNGADEDEAMEQFDRYKPVLRGQDSSLRSELDDWIESGIQEHENDEHDEDENES
jgi:hypothetical protein